jgi:C4-dicarboxylate-specific signal transduction histidine kinase
MHGLVVMAQGGEFAPSRFELRAMVEEVVGLRRSSFGRARIKVTIAPAARELWVRASRADIVRVTANLMLNAERAVSGRPGAEILFAVSLEGAQARLTVQDNGPGIDPAVQSSLFEPFGTGGGTTPGLGLYVSKALAERAGGVLRLFSNEGGARFVLDLPLAP